MIDFRLSRPSFTYLITLLITLSVIIWFASGTATHGQDSDQVDVEQTDRARQAGAEKESQKLKFSFRHAPWEDVLEWLAEEADLSFSTEVVPTGTFNYIDLDQSFTAKEALDLVNSYLLIKGYTLVRKGKMLLVIDLEDELDAKLVRDLLTETPASELDQRGEYEITKTRFNLTTVDAAEAEKQISELMSPVGSIVVMPGAKQIMATETGGTLRMIRDILVSLEKTAAEDEKGKLHTYSLKIATADEVLIVARPLLGIEDEEFASEDESIRISAGAFGRRVFATGDPEKIKLIKQIVEQVDSRDPAGDSSGILEPSQFMTHTVSTTDPDSVLRVLQTLFVGDQSVRLEVDRSTGGIFAYAKTSQHRSIKATIAEMELNPERVQVIPLRATDPAAATLLIEKLFSTNQKPPIVDGTLNPPQLVVRGSQPQIDQILLLLKDMGEDPSAEGRFARKSPRTGNIRLIPMTPESASVAIERIRRIWPSLRRENELRVVAPAERSDLLRTIRPDEDESRMRRRPPRRERPELDRRPDAPTTGPADDADDDREARRPTGSELMTRNVSDLATDSVEPQEVEPEAAQPAEATAAAPVADSPADIIVAPTPDGLMISSDDTEALNAIQTLLEAFAGAQLQPGPRFNLFYLKHIEAEAAQTLLTSILTGLATSTGPTISSSASATASTPRTGPVSIQQSNTLGFSIPHMVADKRLNALFIHGEPAEVGMIKQLLEVIDIESGPEEVLTFPKPRFIPVFNTDAENVAKVIREVYANRIITGEDSRERRSGNNDRGRGGFPFGGGGFFGRGRGGDDNQRGGGNAPQQAAAGELPKMTVGVDVETNSLVVSAPGPLLSEVESVVRELDRRAADKPPESIAVFNLKRTEPYVIRDTLVNLLGDQVEVTESSVNNGGSAGRPSQPSPSGGRSMSGGSSAADFLNRMRSGGTGGGFRGAGGERGGLRGGAGGGGLRRAGGERGGGGFRGGAGGERGGGRR